MADVIRAQFTDYDGFVRALRALKETDLGKYTAYGPTNLDDEVCDLMPRRDSPVRIWATVGALLGLATFWVMCVLSSLIYNLIVGGKPPVSNVPFVVPAYEGTILAGGIGAFIAAMFCARLDVRNVPDDWDPAFVQTTYGVDVKPGPSQHDKVIELFQNAGASEIHEIDG